MDIVIGAYWVENENNGVRSIIGELPDDVCEESGWKGLKLEKAKRLNDLADILPCPDLENEVFKLQEYLDFKEIRLCRVFLFFIEHDDVNSHSYNYLTGENNDPTDLDIAPWTQYGNDLSFLTDWYDGEDWRIVG